MSNNSSIQLNPKGFNLSNGSINSIVTEKLDFIPGQTTNRVFIIGGDNNLDEADLALINNISGLLKRLKGME